MNQLSEYKAGTPFSYTAEDLDGEPDLLMLTGTEVSGTVVFRNERETHILQEGELLADIIDSDLFDKLISAQHERYQTMMRIG